MVRIGEHRMTGQFRGESEIPPVVGELSRFGDRGLDTAECLYVPSGGRFRWMLPQMRRVAVVPAEIALIDGLDVVADRAVVTAGVPGRVEHRWHREVLGDLAAEVALVESTQRLIVQVGVQVALLGQIDEDLLGSPPRRPMMRRESDIGVVGEHLDGLAEVPGPDPGVANLCTAEGQEVVKVVSCVLRQAQCSMVGGEPEVHLRRRFRPPA